MTHLNKWDVRIERQWHPHYQLDGHRIPTAPAPPVILAIAAEFDDEQAARTFEMKVRDLLQELDGA